MKGAPWETSACIPHGSADAEWQVCEAGGGDAVAVICDSVHGTEEDARRAHLIAEAPALEDALRSMVAVFNVREIDPLQAFIVIERVRAILARIDGAESVHNGE